MKKIVLFLVVLALAVPAFAGEKGNGAPSGPHYNLNLIGVPNPKTADMTGDNGARIFMPLWGKANIKLCNSSDPEGPCYGMDFAVLDANGTDNDGASFALPEPDPTNSGTSQYSVFARALGKPGGTAKMTTCATDPVSDEIVCSMAVLNLDRSHKGFDNVTKYLLYIYYDLDGDGTAERIPLFYDSLEEYFWMYDNSGLKLAQLRFYPGVQTTVPAVWP